MDQPRVQLLHDTFFDFAPAPFKTASPTVAEIESLGRSINPGPVLRLVKDELREASFLQRELCPRILPDIQNAQVHAWCRSKGSVGGDLHDVFRIDDSRVGFWIVDATGHNFSSAILAAMARGVLGTYARTALRIGRFDSRDALSLLNEEILGHGFADCSFVAAVCGTYDQKTRTLRWTRAGTPAPLAVDAIHQVTRLESEGTVLGMIDDPPLVRRQHVLGCGEMVSFFTDGLEEISLDWARALRSFGTHVPANQANSADSVFSNTLDPLELALNQAVSGETIADDVTVLTFRAIR